MERSWDYLLKTPAGLIFAIVASLMVLTFIVLGGIYMRFEMMRQREARQKLRESQGPEKSESPSQTVA